MTPQPNARVLSPEEIERIRERSHLNTRLTGSDLTALLEHISYLEGALPQDAAEWWLLDRALEDAAQDATDSADDYQAQGDTESAETLRLRERTIDKMWERLSLLAADQSPQTPEQS